jgi:3-hydroxyisobutyrate/3-hydroxypropionate dehydrogenase
VPKGFHVKLVYLDDQTGVIAANPGSGKKIFFEMSTIEASITREVGQKIQEAGFGTYFDSPISVLLFICSSDNRVEYLELRMVHYLS